MRGDAAPPALPPKKHIKPRIPSVKTVGLKPAFNPSATHEHAGDHIKAALHETQCGFNGAPSYG